MTAPSKYRNVSPCGTLGAGGRHRYYGEPLCDACRKAEAAQKRRQRRGLNPKRKAPRHGTISGYRHLHKGERACKPCRQAIADYNHAWRQGRSLSKRHDKTSVPELIIDVLETFDTAMTAPQLADEVTRIRPGVAWESVRTAIFRMARRGELTEKEPGLWGMT